MANPVQRRHRTAYLSGGLFLPPDVLNLKARWLSNAGTWQDSTLTTQAAVDADPVGGWVDQVGGVAAIQATAGLRPALKMGAFGDMPGLLFTAASSQVLTADALAATWTGTGIPFTFIAIYKFTAAAVACAQLSLGHTTNTSTYDLLGFGATNVPSITRRDDATTALVAGTGSIGSLQPECLVGVYDGTSILACYLGGKFIHSVAATATAMTTDQFTIGAWRRNTTLANYMGGSIAEIAAYQSGLTASQIFQWAQYANRAYGATLR
jgi:hypothetical protein